MEMVVKGKVISEKKPLVCVPIMEHTMDKIISEAKRLEINGAQMMEWRVDAFEGALEIEKIQEVLLELEKIVSKTIFVYTFRSKSEGGLCDAKEDLISNIYLLGAESAVVDFVDVEFYSFTGANAMITRIQELGKKVISSYHNFEMTPELKGIEERLDGMAKSTADIVKIALMPHSKEDVLRLLEGSILFKEKYENRLLISMSMGELGVVSRIMGSFTGSCVSFGIGKEKSAPGQIKYENLQRIIEYIG